MGKDKKKKGKKRKKDPNAPKRPTSSFMFFANEKRAEVRTANPDLKITDVGRKLGEMWKELPSDERKPYEEKAAADKERYTKAMAKYQKPEDDSSSSSDSDEPKKKRRKKNKDPNKPKRAMSSFMFFANAKRGEVREREPNIKITEIGKRLAEMWKEITPTEKKKYEDMAAKDKERYQSAMASYKPPVEKQEEEASSSSSSSSSDSSSDSD